MSRMIRTLCVCLGAAWLWTGPAAWGQNRQSAGEPGRTGLDALSDERLMSELATRRMDTLLNHYFEVNNIPAEKRRSVTVLMQLERLGDESDQMTNLRRQELVRSVAANISEVLPQLTDPVMLMQYATRLLMYGVEPDVNTLEYWGENPRTQAQLRPVVEAVVALLDKAHNEARAAADAIAGRPGFNPNNMAVAREWERADQWATTAEYTKNMVLYNLALALDKSDPRRRDIAEQAIDYLEQYDNADSGVQAAVRNRIAKLRMAQGDYAEAKRLFEPVAQASPDIVPPAELSQQYEARYFMALCDLHSKDLEATKKALADLRAWQAANLPQDNERAVRGAEAAAQMLEYRIYIAEADATEDEEVRKQLNAKARQLLLAQVEQQPALAPIIFDQLVSRLPEQINYTELDELELRALLERGDRERLREDAEPDQRAMERAVDAARELMRRTDTKRELADTASILVPFLLEKLGREVEAAEAFLAYVTQPSPGRYRETAFEFAGSLITRLYREMPREHEDYDKVVALYDQLLPLAINPPYNRRELALTYARRLMLTERYKDSVHYFQMVPLEDNPQAIDIQFMHMVALKGWLDTDSSLDDAQRTRMLSQLQDLAAAVRTGAVQRLNSATTDAQRLAARTLLVRTTLTAADVAHKNQGDAQQALRLLEGFEQAVQGLPDADDLLSWALFLRISAYMETGQTVKAAENLRAVLEGQDASRGAQMVYTILHQLDQDLEEARAQGQPDEIRQLTQLRAQLTPYLVEWAQNNPDPKVRQQTYRYKVFDADSQRRAAEMISDGDARRKELERVRDEVYRPLQSPENVKLYHATIDDPKRQAEVQRTGEGDPTVQLGIALIEYELGNWKEARSGLGELLDKGRLGTGQMEVPDPTNPSEYRIVDNDVYWEARYKQMDANWRVAEVENNDALKKSIADDLKLLYVKWMDRIGGRRYRPAFEELRKKIVPDFVPPQATQPAGQR